MTVTELIELLKTCDPAATVVATTKMYLPPDEDTMDNIHKIIGIDRGFTEADTMDWHLTFCKEPSGYSTIPTVRLIGYDD